jgi:FKBP-type peptidyl-prolyl cis-trans isomerase FkpA
MLCNVRPVRYLPTAFLCAGLLAAGCRDVDRDDVPEQLAAPPGEPTGTREVATDYAPGLEVDLERMRVTTSGLYVEDIEVGTGALATVGRHVEVHYTGWLPDGTRFDSSRDRDDPFSFVLGTGAVIPGWEEGISGMREGGRRRLVIPSALAYGRDGYGVIPQNATLVFETELVAVQ